MVIGLSRIISKSIECRAAAAADHDVDLSARLFEGRVARAVSLCLYNKIHMAQLFWPESISTARPTTSQASLDQMKFVYEGLSALDETRLDEMTETDLIF